MKTLRTLPVPFIGAALLTLAACAPAETESGASAEASAAASSPASSEGHEAMESDDADEAMDSGEEVTVPDQLQFTTTTVADGAAFDGASLAGQDAVIWVWASWCPTCQAEAPAVAEASTRLPEGVELYGLAGKSEVADAQGFIEQYDVADFPHLFDEDGTLWANFGVSYQPALVLIDDDGSIEVIPGATGADEIVAAAEELALS